MHFWRNLLCAHKHKENVVDLYSVGASLHTYNLSSNAHTNPTTRPPPQNLQFICNTCLLSFIVPANMKGYKAIPTATMMKIPN